ncbi:hypothetical protein [Pontibacter mangrovi]|uniref:Entericidin n=1 Tax=Pontibacter mangrovi TaxID=2589816 RepID=A0A501W5S6_9BACT|nr:hypothetical protein [Pontibacter mangrovi]TPE45253.1 hypothetical protein FJM65_04230 [Pontibacter mangrovi]
MKSKYAFVMATAMMAATAFTSCSNENTTGVDTDGATQAEDMDNSTRMDEVTADTMNNAGSGTMGDTISTDMNQ